ncbi:unnamed protein product [Linum tenue]|uniref:Uncharacterized protein n=1 Tax=Linum tenue TaxID=586396 RepID=A0AAV0HXF0_9ROSI|nr:unnamed protein product [Linum tenue]
MAASSPANSNSNSNSNDYGPMDSLADFLRFKKGPVRGTGELQTAIVSYRKQSPDSTISSSLQVDLVSAIHIADKEYYSTLQKELESYDCVLYEMVTKGKKENPETATRLRLILRTMHSWFDRILIDFGRRLMAPVLSLDDQVKCLNYEAENWYHADLDNETFTRLQSKGKLLIWTAFLLLPTSVAIAAIRLCTGRSPAPYFSELAGALSRLDSDAAMKVSFANLLTSEFVQKTADEEETSVVIGERNRVAIEALKRAMDEKGHHNSKIAIFYGAAHMRDLGRRLKEEFDLVPSGQHRWMTAWSVEKASGWTLHRCLNLALLCTWFSPILSKDLLFWKRVFGRFRIQNSRIADYVSRCLV